MIIIGMGMDLANGAELEAAAENNIDFDPFLFEFGGNTLAHDPRPPPPRSPIEREAMQRLRDEHWEEFSKARGDDLEQMIAGMVDQILFEREQADIVDRRLKVEDEVSAKMAIHDRYADRTGQERMSGDERATWEDFYRRQAEKNFGLAPDTPAPADE